MPQALKQNQTKPLPKHIAIIMDGNRRWAAEHNVPRLAGHKKGIEAARRCVEAALDLGIEYLTLYTFSSENWKRPAEEVDGLMGLLRLYVGSELARMADSGVKVKIIGRRDNMPADVLDILQKAEQLTRANTKLCLTLAINYGSHDEILEALRTLAKEVEKGTLKAVDITSEHLGRALETEGIPDPDMVIRTGGEKRLSNFLLWQSAYSELVFMEEYWPDFDAGMLERAIREYQARERRYGARK
jgi:undecaprenyl diphosphate synthase